MGETPLDAENNAEFLRVKEPDVGVHPERLGAGLIVALWVLAVANRAAVAEPPQRAEAARNSLSSQELEHVRGLLQDGFTGTPAGLRAAERHYEAVRRLRPDDPRIPYAFGLVLLKNLKYSQAAAEFRLACEGAAPYLPAGRAVVRELLRRKQYEEAIDELLLLAEAVRRTKDPPPDATSREETARWIGRVMQFLMVPLASEDIRDKARFEEVPLLRRLGDEYMAAYEQGQRDVLAQVGELQAQRKAVEDADALKRQQEQEKAALRREDYRARRRELLDSQEKSEDRLADTVDELDARLDQLGEVFDTLSRAAASLSESIQATQLELSRLQTLEKIRPGRTGSRSAALLGSTEGQMLARSQELNQYFAEYANVLTQRGRVAQQAKQVLGRRKALQQRHREAAGEVAQQVKRLQQWDDRLETVLEDAKKSPAASRAARSYANRARSFSTFDAFDLEAEKERLLASCEIPTN